MAIECYISIFAGHRLVRKLPARKPDYWVTRKRHLFRFYYPLLISAFIGVIIGPLINAMLGKTSDLALSIASYAVAGGIANLILSIVAFSHQIVLNYYSEDRGLVLRFTIMLSLLPLMVFATVNFTPFGEWVLTNWLGINERLLSPTLACLRVFMLLGVVYPWLEF
ncbi:MAG: multi antimicrobial extrusion protein MatE, partial [Bacilli bacterium]